MNRNKELPEWLTFPTEQERTNDKRAWIKIEGNTLTKLDKLVENSHGQNREDVVANLVYDCWDSKNNSMDE